MHILYDHQVFSLQNAGGASRYHFELASHLSALQEVKIDVFLGLNRCLYSFDSLKARGSEILSWKVKMRPGLSRYLINELVTGAYVSAAGKHWDIYHPTLYRHMPFVRSRRIVVTHHDCVHERFPELFADSQRVISAKQRLYKTADMIICVSESSREDLLHFYGIDRNKTRVVHHGISSLKRESNQVVAKRHKPYLLYVGARNAYKNFDGFLDAYKTSGVSREFDLVVIGSEFTRDETKLISQLELSNRVINLGPASDTILAEMYRNACLFVYPSLYEGFGFPPLEAMSLGCPVVAARVASIPEVCEDAAYYFDPAVVGDLGQTLCSALNDPNRESRVRHGVEVASRYQWRICASRTLQVYKEL